MRLKKFAMTAFFALAVLMLGLNSDVFAQGRGRGGGGGRPTINPSTSRGGGNVDRGITTSSERSNGRSDDGLRTASRNSNGRSDDGLNRARTGGNRDLPDDNELNRYRGISRKLNVSAETLRSRYEAALATNPDLKWGQFVAANVIASNLRRRNSRITAAAILAGLERGDSIGETLRSFGLSSDDAKQAEKGAKQQIKESRKNQ
jgi:hypothetical protein